MLTQYVVVAVEKNTRRIAAVTTSYEAARAVARLFGRCNIETPHMTIFVDLLPMAPLDELDVDRWLW